ncbi:MAG: hypothetical protein LIO96_07450 [Lachnospiraceae bacterium]|nr:hypothetical protein [Lachnospiraceae bacterium]
MKNRKWFATLMMSLTLAFAVSIPTMAAEADAASGTQQTQEQSGGGYLAGGGRRCRSNAAGGDSECSRDIRHGGCAVR